MLCLETGVMKKEEGAMCRRTKEGKIICPAGRIGSRSNHLLWIYEIRISEAQTRGRELIHDVV